jgi:hypothetical protein
LQLTLEVFTLDIWDEERRNQILDKHGRLILLGLGLVQELVNGLYLEFSLIISLNRRGSVDGGHHNVLEIRIDRTLMNAHQLFVKNIFSLSQDQLSLTSTGLTSLTLSSLFFGHLYHSSNATFLLKLDKLFSQVVHSLGDNGRLESLGDTVDDALLIALDEVSLLGLGTLGVLGGDVELLDQIETHLLSSEHIVLSRTSSEESLETDNSDLPTVSNGSLSLSLVSVRELIVGCVRSHSCTGISLVFSLQSIFLSVDFFLLHVNDLGGLLEGFHVGAVLSVLLFLEVVFAHVDIDLRLESERLLVLEEGVELVKTLV